MASIVTAVLKGTLGLLAKKGRSWVAEKLKDGDVTDQKLRSWIVNEMDNVNSKLDAIARSDLGASISFFKEGLVFLNKVLNTETSSDINISHTATAAVKTSSLAEELKGLDLTDLDDSDKEAFSDARKRFDEARREATRAFNNEALTLSDRILAMAVRLMATILEKVENPASALAVCRSCLEELHLMPGVRENFTVEFAKGVWSKFSKDERRAIISAVCQINRVIFDVTQMAGEGKAELLLWPCVEIGGNERVDPLRDSRVTKMLRKLEMGDCSLAWSFGQEGDEKDERLQSARSIATNTLGHFFVADNLDRCIKVFDTTGKILYYFRGLLEFASVAIDRDDNVYTLQSGFESRVFMFDKQGNFHHKFPVSYRFIGDAVRVTDGHNLLVSGKSGMIPSFGMERPKRGCVLVYNGRDSPGSLIGELSARAELNTVQDMTVVNDGRIMVLDDESCVHVFSNITAVDDEHSHFRTRSKYLQKFPVADAACAIAFHWMSGHVIIASKSPDGPSWVSIYSKDGEFERNIQLELEKNDWISAAAVTTDGRICVCATAIDGAGQTIGKVLVL